ncbi:hypothetical protein Tco_1429787 [Tanacetum coccineum]
MVGLPRCHKLRRSCCSKEWEDMFILYCRRAVVEDSSLASEINGLYAGLTAHIEEREYFIDELDNVSDIFVPEKMAKIGIVVLIHCCYEDEVYRYWSMVDDYRLVSEINRAAIEVNNVVMQKDQFLEELDSLGTRHVPVKMAEFLREIQAKDKETVEKLQILEREMELNARKKELFIEKRKGVVLY